MFKTIYQLFEEGHSRHEGSFEKVLYMTTDKNKALQHFEEERIKIGKDRHFFLCNVRPKVEVMCKDTEYETPQLLYSDDNEDSSEYYCLYIRTTEFEE